MIQIQDVWINFIIYNYFHQSKMTFLIIFQINNDKDLSDVDELTAKAKE